MSWRCDVISYAKQIFHLPFNSKILNVQRYFEYWIPSLIWNNYLIRFINISQVNNNTHKIIFNLSKYAIQFENYKRKQTKENWMQAQKPPKDAVITQISKKLLERGNRKKTQIGKVLQTNYWQLQKKLTLCPRYRTIVSKRLEEKRKN